MNNDPAFYNDFEFVVLIAVEHRKKEMEIAQWLIDNIQYQDVFPSNGTFLHIKLL